MPYDVLALGELLIDFTPAGTSPAGSPMFEQNPGGAPANVLVALTRLGARGAFIGKVGDDSFGQFLKQTLLAHNVGIDGLKFTHKDGTTLAFVHLDPTGNRSFTFRRNPGADTLLEPADIDESLIRKCKIFHFGSLSLTNEPARAATLHAAELAKKLGKTISYDPNYRPLLWKDKTAAIDGMRKGLQFADILKISDEEATLLTGQSDYKLAAKRLLESGPKIVLVTLGPKGSFFQCRDGAGECPAFPVQVVDTTGAGDAFLGGFLYQFLNHNKPPETLGADELTQMVRFASAVGSLCTTAKGAITAMPSLAEVQAVLNSNP